MGAPQRRPVRRRPAQRDPGRPVRGRSLRCAPSSPPRSRGVSSTGRSSRAVPATTRCRPCRGPGFGAQATDALGCAAPRRCGLPARRTPAEAGRVLFDVGMRVNARVETGPGTRSPAPGCCRSSRATRCATGPRPGCRSWSAAPATRCGLRVRPGGGLTEARYREMMAEAFGDACGRRARGVPGHRLRQPGARALAVLSDWGGQIGACPVLRTAEPPRPTSRSTPTSSPRTAARSPGGFPMGAYHGLDVPYTVDLNGTTRTRELTPEQQRLSATMIGYWSAFAHTGNPNGPGRPRWPEFAPRAPSSSCRPTASRRRRSPRTTAAASGRATSARTPAASTV